MYKRQGSCRPVNSVVIVLTPVPEMSVTPVPLTPVPEMSVTPVPLTPVPEMSVTPVPLTPVPEMSVTPVPEGFVSVAAVIFEVSDVVLPVDGLAAVVCVVLTVVCLSLIHI